MKADATVTSTYLLWQLHEKCQTNSFMTLFSLETVMMTMAKIAIMVMMEVSCDSGVYDSG